MIKTVFMRFRIKLFLAESFLWGDAAVSIRVQIVENIYFDSKAASKKINVPLLGAGQLKFNIGSSAEVNKGKDWVIEYK